MKPLLFIAAIVVSAVLFSQGACSKKKPAGVDANASAGSLVASEGDRSRAQSLLESGREFYRTDLDEKAVEAFMEATRLDPELAEAHFRLGLAYDAVGKENEAEESYKKAVEKYKKQFQSNDKDAEGHYNLGQTYAGLKLYSEAIREYRQATRLKSDDSDIYYDLGVALSKLANYDEAVSAFSKSLEIDPENYRADDALEEAREGAKRIRAGKKHQEDLLKKQKKEDESENANDGSTNSNAPRSSKANSNSKSNSNSKPKPKPTRKPGTAGQ
ncbi:MAG TPA: tetratricopeptide repeat protein [Pyrinomonadaceae bacterium]|nr:tetratricopeptide repeat protein [Pyrinomonadaceae bacterium]